MLFSTNVNKNVPLTYLYCFLKLTFAGKACPVIYRSDTTRTNTNDPISTALSAVKRLFFDNVRFCVLVAGFDAIFDWYAKALILLSHCHVDAMCSIIQKIGFLNLHTDVQVTSNVF